MMDLIEVAKVLKVAFPGYDIGAIRRVIVGDAHSATKARPGWDILIADPVGKSVERKGAKNE